MKKLICLLMTLLMVVTVLPLSALAEGEGTETTPTVEKTSSTSGEETPNTTEGQTPAVDSAGEGEPAAAPVVIQIEAKGEGASDNAPASATNEGQDPSAQQQDGDGPADPAAVIPGDGDDQKLDKEKKDGDDQKLDEEKKDGDDQKLDEEKKDGDDQKLDEEKKDGDDQKLDEEKKDDDDQKLDEEKKDGDDQKLDEERKDDDQKLDEEKKDGDQKLEEEQKEDEKKEENIEEEKKEEEEQKDEKEEDPATFPVTFSILTESVTIQVAAGEALEKHLPVDPKLGDAYVFEGWYDEKGNPVNASTLVNGPLTVTARLTYLPKGGATKTDGGVTVTASWGEGVFPEGTAMKLDPQTRDKALSMAEKALAEGYEAVDGVAVDITFVYDGKSIQPETGKSVTIKMTLSSPLEGSQFFVLHEKTAQPTRGAKKAAKSSGGGVETISATSTETGASFSAGSFSVYAIVGAEYEDEDLPQYARNTYRFYNGDPGEAMENWPMLAERIYCHGDTMETPGDPSGDSRHPFLGWFLADDSGNLTDVEIKTGATVIIDPPTQEEGGKDHEYKVYAKYGRLYACKFYTDESLATVYKAYVKAAGESVTLPGPADSDWQLPVAKGKAFMGWRMVGETGAVAGPSILMGSADLELVPVLANIHTVAFDLVLDVFEDVNIGAQRIEDGQKAAAPGGFTVGEVHKGHKLLGWYRDGQYTEPAFDFNTPLTETDPEEITLYAKWEPQEIPVDVIPYLEKKNDPAYAARAGDKKTLTLTVGQKLSDEDIAAILSQFPSDKYKNRTDTDIGFHHWSGTGQLDKDTKNGILIGGRILPALQFLNPDGSVQAEYDVKTSQWVNGVAATAVDGMSVRVNYNRNRYHLYFYFDDAVGNVTGPCVAYNGMNLPLTMNEAGKAIAPEGYADVELPTIVVKYAQHLYKVTHLVYTEYGPMFDAFLKSGKWKFMRESNFYDRGSATFDETHTGYPLRTAPGGEPDGGGMIFRVAEEVSPYKQYIFINRYYDARYPLEQIAAGEVGPEHYVEYVSRVARVSSSRYGSSTLNELGRVVGADQLVAITGQAGYNENNVNVYPAEEPLIMGDEIRGLGIYSKNGHWNGDEATGNPDPADPVYKHWFPSQFTITFRQTKNGTVNGLAVSGPEDPVVIEGVYYRTKLDTAFWKEHAMPDYARLTDIQGKIYTAADGWKGDVDEETGALPQTMPGQDVVFYKAWEPVTCTVVFHPNNGEDEKEQTVHLVGKAEMIPTPLLDGKLFGGWYMDEACTAAYDFQTQLDEAKAAELAGPDGRIHLYAKWNSANPYSIRYEKGDGRLTGALAALLTDDNLDKQTYMAGSEAMAKGVAERDGMVFIGWKLGDTTLKDGSTFTVDSTNDRADGTEDQVITLIAQYEIQENVTSVTYHSNFPDGTPDKSITVNNLVVNGTYTIDYDAANLAFIPNDGMWVFRGWKTTGDEKEYSGNGDYFQKGEKAALGQGDNDLYAVWTRSATPTPTPSPTPTATPTATPAATPTATPTATSETTPTGTPEPTPTATPEPTPTATPEPTPTATPEPTPTATPATVSLTVKKVWNDSDDAARKRSGVEANILLQKTVNGVSTQVDAMEVGHNKGWTYTWEDLPAYEAGAAVTYSVKEELVKPNGYKSDTTKWKTVADGETITIKNTYRDPDITPGTGDSRKTLLWAGLMLTSALGCAAALLLAKRKQQEA